MKKIIALTLSVLMFLSISLGEESTALFQKGDNNENVAALHMKLNELGLLSVSPDTPFNDVSEEALKVLQTALGTEATGTIDNQEALDQILSIDENTSLGNVLHNAEEPQISEKSDYNNGIWRVASGGSGIREVVDISAAPIEGISRGFHIVGTADDTKHTEVATDKVPVVFEAKYILSCYARGNGKITLQHGKKPYIRKIFDVTEDWQEYSIEFTIGYKDGSTASKPSTNVFFGVAKETDSDVTICGMKLEAVIGSLRQDKNILNNAGQPQIGKSDYENGVWRSASSGSGIREIIENIDVEGIEKGIHIVGSVEDQKDSSVAISQIPVEVGAKYILSCFAKGTGKIILQHGTKPYPKKTFDVTPEWELYSIEFVVGDKDGSTEESPATNVFFGVPKGMDSDVSICNMTLTKQ